MLQLQMLKTCLGGKETDSVLKHDWNSEVENKAESNTVRQETNEGFLKSPCLFNLYAAINPNDDCQKQI